MIEFINPKNNDLELNALEPVCFDNGNFIYEYKSKQFKKWQYLTKVTNQSSFTDEEIIKTNDGIKNKLGVDLKAHFEDKLENVEPRIEWNVVKKCWLNPDENNLIKYKLIRNRKWPLEFYFVYDPTKKVEPPPKVNTADSKTAVKGSKPSSSKASMGSGLKGKQAAKTPIHLMSFVDISNLLYPGVKRTRVICDVRTYTELEIQKETGTDDSIFLPKPKPVMVEIKDDASSPPGKDAKAAKPIKPKKGKSQNVTSEDMEPEGSTQLVNINGDPTFIIIEVELVKPLYKKRNLENLSAEIKNMLPERDELPKYVMSKSFAKIKFEDCIKSLIGNIYQDFQKYDTKTTKDKKIVFFQSDIFNFTEYLQRTGRYQEYLTTLLKEVVTYVSEHFDIKNSQKTHKQFENFISTVYVHLVGNINRILNGPITCGLDVPAVTPPESSVSYIFSAREAEEIGAPLLAERYHNEQISKFSRNADIWLNYAVYYLGLKLFEQGLECVKECLALQVNHRYGLLLYAVMLYFQKEWYYSETTFLTLLNYYPRYIEGWVCLYIFYLARDNHVGCDICQEKIDKLSMNEEVMEKDYITAYDDIAWTTDIYPKQNKFFQTAMVLLKLRAVMYAEMTMGFMIFPEKGELDYYIAVIRYLTRDYPGALLYLKNARKEHGPDFAVNSLIGHCYYKLQEFQKAKEAYEFVVLSFNRPDDMHLLYLNLALIYERENNLEKTKQYLLHVCKYSPTAYDWLLLGICYFKEESWTYAEECFTESNLQDCSIPETWAYLTLTNLKIGNPWIAGQCYQQMIKRDLQNDWLFEQVEREIHKE